MDGAKAGNGRGQRCRGNANRILQACSRTRRRISGYGAVLSWFLLFVRFPQNWRPSGPDLATARIGWAS